MLSSPFLIRSAVFMTLFLCACFPASRPSKPQSGAQSGRAAAGLYGNLTATGGARPPTPHCGDHLTASQMDSCIQAGERALIFPLRATVVIRNLGTRDSVSLKTDSLGAYRAELKPGSYQVCFKGDLLEKAFACSEALEVRHGAFTAFNLTYPFP
jgi:hypothetical protein